MVKPTVSTVLWMVFAWMMSMPVTAEEVKKSPASLVEMSLSPSRIDWLSTDPAAKVQRWVLTLSGPEELFFRREFKAGKAPFLSVFDSEGDRLPDGSYTWALKAISNDSVDPRRESGSFSIQDGSFVEAPRTTGSGAPKPPLVPNIAESSLIDGDLAVRGNACIGNSCSITDPNFSALKLKSVQPNILFDDIALPEGPTSSHDWALFANYNDVDQFSIVDFSNARFPFNIAAGAPDNSLFIAGNGNVGLGTSTPVVRLDVKVNASAAGAGRIQNSSATGYSGWEYLGETGAAISYVGLVNSSKRFQISTIYDYPIVLITNGWERLRIDSDGDVGISCDTPASDLVIASSFGCNPPSSSINAGSTSFTASSSRTIKEKLSPVEIPDILEKMAGVGVYTYDFIGGPKERIGLMAEDFHQIFQRGSDKLLDGQEVEMALWLAVQELTAQNKKLAAQNKEISERLAELEARLATGPVNTP